MSRPESVSSRIAICGLSSSSWAISCRFFSPPEKPSLTERCAERRVQVELLERVVDVLDPGAELRGLAVEGGLGGAQEVRHRHARDLDGVLHGQEEPGAGALVDGHRQDVRAVEGHRATGDGVLRVAGDGVGQGRLAGPVRAHDRVGLAVLDGQRDALEDLLGAVLGVDRDVQVLDLQRAHRGISLFFEVCGQLGSTPLSGSVVSTYTSPSRTSTGNVATGSVAGGPIGLPVRRSNRDPCSQHSTLQSVDLALAQRHRGVRAEVLDGEHLVAVAGDGQVEGPDRDAERLVVGHLVEGADAFEGHQLKAFRTFLASSASTVENSCSSSAGTSILRIRSLKKPCTTRRRASDSSMPRERR